MSQPVGEQSDTKLAVMLVMMWKRLGIPCLYDAVSTVLKIAMKPTMPGGFPGGNRTKLKLMGTACILLLFR